MSDPSTVYQLWFVREYDDRRETELQIGIYSSEKDALATIEKLTDQPGFRDFPSGFEIHEATLGQTGWTCGYITEYGPPPKDALAEPFDLPAFVLGD